MDYKTARVNAGMTQKQAAEVIGVTPGTISQWESGLTKPSIGRLRKVAECYKCSFDELVKERLQ